jgi:hypothetical protein
MRQVWVTDTHLPMNHMMPNIIDHFFFLLNLWFMVYSENPFDLLLMSFTIVISYTFLLALMLSSFGYHASQMTMLGCNASIYLSFPKFHRKQGFPACCVTYSCLSLMSPLYNVSAIYIRLPCWSLSSYCCINEIGSPIMVPSWTHVVDIFNIYVSAKVLIRNDYNAILSFDDCSCLVSLFCTSYLVLKIAKFRSRFWIVCMWSDCKVWIYIFVKGRSL